MGGESFFFRILEQREGARGQARAADSGVYPFQSPCGGGDECVSGS